MFTRPSRAAPLNADPLQAYPAALSNKDPA